MAMTISSSDGDENELNSAINTTPLVDVMLVLLIIFLITIPVVTQTAPVSLPKEASVPTQTKPENISLSVDKDGGVYWNQELLNGQGALLDHLKVIATQTPQPEVHIRGDLNVRYEYVGRLIAACQKTGIAKVGFITEPPPRG